MAKKKPAAKKKAVKAKAKKAKAAPKKVEKIKRISIRTEASARVTEIIDEFDEENPTKKSIREFRKALSELSKERYPKGGLVKPLEEYTEGLEEEEEVEEEEQDEVEQPEEEETEETEEEEEEEVEEKPKKKAKKAPKKKAKKTSKKK